MPEVDRTTEETPTSPSSINSPAVSESGSSQTAPSSPSANPVIRVIRGFLNFFFGLPQSPPPAHVKTIYREYAESIVVTIVMAMFGITFVVRSVNVPTGSMENTIHAGDFLLVNKFIFGPDEGTLATSKTPINLNLDALIPHRPIRRGDIIVFKYPPDPTQNYVKRVIGLPGETIEIRGKRILINKQELPELRTLVEQDPNDKGRLIEQTTEPNPAARYKVFYEDEFAYELDRQVFGLGQPYKIPDNCYFAMGDNRDNSLDSRVWGPVPRNNIIGRPLFAYASAIPSEDKDGNPQVTLGDLAKHPRWYRAGTVIK